MPVKINGVAMSLVELIASLETIAGAHGVGRIDMVENRLVGIKSREIYEAPAAVALHAAHQRAAEVRHPARPRAAHAELGVKYADLVYNGLWFTPTREAHRRARREGSGDASPASIRLKLFKGDCRVVGRKSPFALYDHALATYDAGDQFDHTAAEGFMKIWGCRSRSRRGKR